MTVPDDSLAIDRPSVRDRLDLSERVVDGLGSSAYPPLRQRTGPGRVCAGRAPSRWSGLFLPSPGRAEVEERIWRRASTPTRFSMNRWTCLVAVWGVVSATLCLGQSADEALNQIFEDYHEGYLVLFPLEATAHGDTRYNDQLQIDISPEFVARKRRFYTETLQRLRAIDRRKASPPAELSAEILEYELASRLEGIAFNFERIPFNQFDGLPLVFAQMGSGSGNHPFRTVKDYDDWLERMDRFSLWSVVAIERFREGMKDAYVLPRILVERMVAQLLDPTIVTDDAETSLFYGPVLSMPASFSDTDRQRLTNAFKERIREKVIPAYRSMGEFLRDEYMVRARETAGIGALEDGRDQYRYWVRRWTTTSLTPEEIFRIGEAEVARIRTEMDAVRVQMGFEGSLREFFDHLRTDPVYRPFKTPDEIIDLFSSIHVKVEPEVAKAFLKVPRARFEIRRTEAFREKTASAEYVAGSVDGSRPGIFYVPIPDASQFNITGGVESLFLHEAIPGHHYQVSLQQENQELPAFARILWYGAYGEGWALYCESMGEELGLYTDPRQRIGALGDEMHRAVRLVVDVGLHWKGWTREEAIAYMRDNEPISDEGLVSEAERYMAYTAQALAYKIGQLKIRELRTRCEQRLGDRFSLPEFHDEVLRNGVMPLDILEARLDRWQPPGR